MSEKETNYRVVLDVTKEEDYVYKELTESLNRGDYKWYLSTTNNCIYFIVNDILYGYTVLRYSSINKPLKICWKEDSEYILDDSDPDKIVKDIMRSYDILSYEEVKIILNF